jgi:phage-related protein
MQQSEKRQSGLQQQDTGSKTVEKTGEQSDSGDLNSKSSEASGPAEQKVEKQETKEKAAPVTAEKSNAETVLNKSDVGSNTGTVLSKSDAGSSTGKQVSLKESEQAKESSLQQNKEPLQTKLENGGNTDLQTGKESKPASLKEEKAAEGGKPAENKNLVKTADNGAEAVSDKNTAIANKDAQAKQEAVSPVEDVPAPAGSEKADKAEGAANSEKAQKQPAKAPAVKISGEDPLKILNQLGSIPPTEAVNAFSQAAAVSDGAFEKQRARTQAVMPEIPTPTGLPAKKDKGIKAAAARIKEIKHNEPAAFKSEKTGGKAHEGVPGDIKLSSDPEADADDVMAEARQYSKNTPSIGMTGEADPNQMEGFKSEAEQNVRSAEQAELIQTNQDFGENGIAPKEDTTSLKAAKPISPVIPLGLEINRTAPIPPDVASIANPQLSSELKTFMKGKENEYQQGKAQFDTGVTNAKQNANEQIESRKTQAKDTQLKEQASAKAEVEGYRKQWRTEVNTAASEYDKEAGTEAEKKKKEVGQIKEEKEGQVKKTMSQAEKDADRECKTAKKEAEEKKKEGEKEHKKNIFEKAWDWAKDKAEKAVDFVKKAVSFVFDKLRQAVKTIFEKAKQAALGLIEQGRKLIVGAIKGLGNVLKGLVKKVFARFPGISKKICGFIDSAVNKATKIVNAAADKLKKGVTAALDIMAKTVDGMFTGIQKLYKTVMSGIKKFLSMDFKKVFNVVLEGARIAAEIAAAVATGGGSVVVQIVTWLTTTLPQLLKQVGSVLNFVSTIRSIKLSDVKQILGIAGIGGFLVKGLFGQLRGLPQEPKEEEEKEPAAGREEKGLIKVLHALTKVLNVLKGVYDKIAGGLNKILGVINIVAKLWFEVFSAIYAGIVTVIEKVGNPAQALSEGAEKLKEAVGEFFVKIKTKVKEISGSIKEKVTLLGQPAQLIKTIANKAVDMVLNFIITHPPSALIKAVFKGIEAIAGKSIVELIRQYIPYADKILDKIAGSGPVQGIMKPLEGPVKTVGGMIDQVTDQTTGMVDSAEKTTLSSMGSGAKLMTAMGIGGQSKNESKAGGKETGQAQGGSKAEGGGDIFGTVRSGIHNNLMTLGLINLKKLGMQILAAGAAKISGAIRKMLTPKVKFKLGNETHELWVEQDKDRNSVMMASLKGTEVEENSEASRILAESGELRDKLEKTKKKQSESQANANLQDLAQGMQAAGQGESEVDSKEDDKPKPMDRVIKVPPFNVKAKFKELKEEYERQVKGQEDGLNRLTIGEFLKNREFYVRRLEEQKLEGKKNPSGRDPKGNTEQQRIRDEAFEDKFNEYLDDGIEPEEAREKANKWIKTQAALHDPDQIAGGNPENVTGMGNARINFSIGSQWKTRADVLENGVNKYITDKNLPDKDFKKVLLNVKLSCGGI